MVVLTTAYSECALESYGLDVVDYLLKTLQQQLPAGRFVRIHHSCIVALDAIDVIHKDKVQIGEQYLPISATYSSSFREAIERYRI